MTVEQAIEIIERKSSIPDGNETFSEDIEPAYNMALSALRAQRERENPHPLTVQELRKMNGQPVWIITTRGIFACIVQITRHRGDVGYIALVHDTHFVFTPNNGAVYKYPPKEDAI